MKLYRYPTFLTYTIRALVISLAMLSSSTFAQNKMSFEEAIAHYTFAVAAHVTWPSQRGDAEITIGIIGASPETTKAFHKKKSAQVNNRNVKIETFEDPNGRLEPYSIIFIGNKARHLNKEIFSKTSSVLIITDGPVSLDEQMISLISSRRKVSIVLNQEALLARGFSVSLDLLELAGTKSDFSKILKQQERQLQTLLGEIGAKDKKLGLLNSSILENSTLLEEANARLDKNTLRLTSLLKEVETTKSVLDQNRAKSATQNLLLVKRQAEVEEKEQEVFALQQSIDENTSILEKQRSMVSQQRNTIKTKDNTITTQRLILVVIITMAFVFFIMIHFLLRSNRLRRQSNDKLEKMNAQLYEVATKDGMTQLFNRRHFFETAQKSLSRQQRHKSFSTLLMLDIDSFKKINDKHGHAAGDAVIQAVAEVLGSDLREYDLVGRIGGEEFSMMLTDCDVDMATDIANRLCREVSELEIVHSDSTIKTSISIGMSQAIPEDTLVADVLNRADLALYEAKNSGKNQVSVYSEDTVRN